MKPPVSDKISDTNISPEERNNLGISRAIYAAGNSVKDAFIWGTIVTVGMIATIAFGKKAQVGFINEAVKTIEEFHVASKEWFGKVFKKLLGLSGAKVELPELTATEIAASIVAGGIVGHAVQIPGGVKGWHDAQKATDKYSALSDERDKLVDANAALILRNQSFREKLQQIAPTSYTELAEKSKTEEPTVGSTR